MLLVWLFITLIAAALAGWASVDAAAFYGALARPDWSPPAWVFGPVWSGLYLLMGVAAWLIWTMRPVRPVKAALALYLVQLGANALWSWLFFAWHQGGLAFADVVFLWGLIVATMVAFGRLHTGAAWLLVPYWLWVSFAAALNLTVWRLNPGFSDPRRHVHTSAHITSMRPHSDAIQTNVRKKGMPARYTGK